MKQNFFSHTRQLKLSGMIIFNLMLLSCNFAYQLKSAELHKEGSRCFSSDVFVTPQSGFYDLNHRDEIDKIQEVVCFDGTLIISGDFAEIYLPNLQYVTGDLIILSAPLRKINLPHLKEVAGSFQFGQVQTPLMQIEQVNVPELREVGQKLTFQYTNFKNLQLPVLRGCTSVILKNNDALMVFSAPKLYIISKDLILSDNLLLKQLQLSRIKRLDRQLQARDNPQLQKCFLEKLSKLLPDAKQFKLEGKQSEEICAQE